MELIRTRRPVGADYATYVKRTVATATGLIVRIDDVAELKSTVFDPSGRNRIRLGDERYDCLKTKNGAALHSSDERLGRRERLSGVEAVVLKGPRSTTWYALAFNCAMIQARYDFGRDGSTQDTLVSLTGGEPSAESLRIPDHYKEVSPSGLGKTASTLLDDKYNAAHRPPAAARVQ